MKGELIMGLKEKLEKKILEMKLNGATKHMRADIQKLQQSKSTMTKLKCMPKFLQKI